MNSASFHFKVTLGEKLYYHLVLAYAEVSVGHAFARQIVCVAGADVSTNANSHSKEFLRR